MTYTRQQYMTNECTHNEYYAQYASDITRDYIANVITLKRINKSKDQHLNDIPLQLWDACPFAGDLRAQLKAQGDTFSLSSIVCIAKATARDMIA